MVCYKIQFGKELTVDANGVPLEHLITCVKDVELKLGGTNHNIKYIVKEVKLKSTEVDINGIIMFILLFFIIKW